jgi:purine-nucleoside phosphorylase
LDLELHLSNHQLVDSSAPTLELSQVPYWKNVYGGGASHSARLVLDEKTHTLLVLGATMPAQPNYAHADATCFVLRILQQLGWMRYLFLLIPAMPSKSYATQASPIVLVKDHVSMIGENPLFGKNVEHWGPRFYDMTDVYSPKLIQALSSQLPSSATVKCLFHAGINGVEQSEYMEIGPMSDFAQTQVLSHEGCREVLVARHHHQEALPLDIAVVGVTKQNDEKTVQDVLQGVFRVAASL